MTNNSTSILERSAAFQREIPAAIERIGRTPSQRVAWLVRFSQCNPSLMSEGDFRNLQWEVHSLDECRDKYDPPPDRKEIEAFRTVVRDILDRVSKKQSFQFVVPEYEYRFYYNLASSKEWTLTGNPKEQLAPTHALVDIIRRHISQILICPECQSIFLADRRNKEYCTPRCQSRVAARRYRRERGLITGRKPGRPPKEEQATTKKTATTKGTRTKGEKKDGKSGGKG